MPEISVIIPMYKTPKIRLRKCLDSLMEQSFTDFEVLVIDDGNAPGYEHIKEEYENADNRISFIRQERGGVSRARNLGLTLARGEYICFVDSDDYVDQSYLLEMRQAMEAADVAICAVSENYHPVFPGWVDHRVFFSKPSYYNGLQYINFCHNKMFRASFLRDNNLRFPEGMKLGEDALFVADCLSCCKSIFKVREPRYHYVPDSNSAVNRYREEFWKWEQQVIRRQWELFHQYPLSEFEEQAMERWLFLKLKYALDYYMWKERDKSKRDKFIEEICSSDLYARLMKCKHNKEQRLMKENERKMLKYWKLYGIHGIKFIHLLKLVRNRLHR